MCVSLELSSGAAGRLRCQHLSPAIGQQPGKAAAGLRLPPPLDPPPPPPALLLVVTPRPSSSPVASAQFASAGPNPPSGGGGSDGAIGRRVYVTNVALDAAPERLRVFFARFGELEGGPFGSDAETGRSLGYALFVYRAAADAATVVVEPYRVFEGRTLHCQLANKPARKAKAPAAQSAPAASSALAAVDAPALQPVLDAIAAAGVGDLAAYARTQRGLRHCSGRTQRLQLRN